MTASRRGRGRRGLPWPPAASGGWLYTLSLALPRRRRIRVGALGTFVFPAGRYLYTGSARRGAAARIARHARRDKRLRWHIDYFRRFALLEGIRLLPAAEAFVNHMLSPKVQKLMSEELWYSPSSKKVTLSPDHQSRLFATEEKVKQLIQADWKWFNANQEQISMRFNKTFQRA